MKQLLLPAAVMIMISTNALAKPIRHSITNSVAISGSSDLSKFSTAALAFVPASKVNIAPTKMTDETNGDENEGYDISMSGKDFKGEVLYDSDGSLIGYYEQIKNTEMPFAVASAIEAKYPGAEFTKDVEKIDNSGFRNDVYKTYFVCQGKHGFALVNADGKIIRSRK